MTLTKKERKELKDLNKKIGKYADLSLVDIHAGFWEIENNLEKGTWKTVHDFKTKLRQICADAGLIHLAEKRWAGQEHTAIHDNSDNKVDWLINVIVAEYLATFGKEID